jgi:hypothetical protein
MKNYQINHTHHRIFNREFNCSPNGLMEKKIATELMEEILVLSAQINVIGEKIEQIASESERKEMRRHLANVMASSDENLFRPVLRQYPELEPHR